MYCFGQQPTAASLWRFSTEVATGARNLRSDRVVTSAQNVERRTLHRTCVVREVIEFHAVTDHGRYSGNSISVLYVQVKVG